MAVPDNALRWERTWRRSTPETIKRLTALSMHPVHREDSALGLLRATYTEADLRDRALRRRLRGLS